MDNFNLCDALSEVLNKEGYKVTIGEIFTGIRDIAAAEIATRPGPPGPTGPMGMTGRDGMAGRDAWDKYAFDERTHQKAQFFWKGLEFWSPVPRHFYDALPVGKELTYGDISFISTMYGTQIIETMAVFWRREYDFKTDISLFINEEDKCHLVNINKSDSSPAHLKV
ncbi:collagen-like protein [Enterobacter hormaechei]